MSLLDIFVREWSGKEMYLQETRSVTRGYVNHTKD